MHLSYVEKLIIFLTIVILIYAFIKKSVQQKYHNQISQYGISELRLNSVTIKNKAPKNFFSCYLKDSIVLSGDLNNKSELLTEVTVSCKPNDGGRPAILLQSAVFDFKGEIEYEVMLYNNLLMFIFKPAEKKWKN